MGFLSSIFGTKRNPITPETKVDEPDFERKLFHFSDVPAMSVNEGDINVYPMRDTPVPVISVDDVVRSQGEIIKEIGEAMPMNTTECDELLFPVIYNLAELVHLIPASSFHHHKGRGGLFRHSLEVGRFSVNLAKNHIFGYNQSAESNFSNKNRWYLACCIAGLLHDVGKVLTSVTITGNYGQTIWHPLSETIVEWARRENIKSYNISWNSGSDGYDLHMIATPIFFWKMVGLPARRYLEESESQVLIAEVVKAIAGVSDSQSIISNIVRSADAQSTQSDIAYQNSGKVTPGVDSPIASIIEGIMAAFIERQKWKPNNFDKDGKLLSPLLVTNKGVFIYWLLAYQDILKELDNQRADSVPRKPDILAEKLCEGRMCEYFDRETYTDVYWKVIPAVTVDGVDPEEAKILYPIKDRDSEGSEEELSEEEQEALQAELAAELSADELPDPNDDGVTVTQKEEKEEPKPKAAPKKPDYNWLNCLKISDNNILFSHISRPAPTLAVVYGIPTSNAEALRWFELTGDAAPKTMIDKDEASLVQDAAREVIEDKPKVIVDESGAVAFETRTEADSMDFTTYDKMMNDELKTMPENNKGTRPIVRTEKQMQELTKDIPTTEAVKEYETKRIDNFANINAQQRQTPASSKKDTKPELKNTKTTTDNNDQKTPNKPNERTVKKDEQEAKTPEDLAFEKDLAMARAISEESNRKKNDRRKDKPKSEPVEPRSTQEDDILKSMMPAGVKLGDEKRPLGPIQKAKSVIKAVVKGKNKPNPSSHSPVAPNEAKEANKPKETTAPQMPQKRESGRGETKLVKPKVEVPSVPIMDTKEGTAVKKDKENKTPSPSKDDKTEVKPVASSAVIEEKAASQKKGKKRGRKPKDVSAVEQEDFKDTAAGKHVARKTAKKADWPKLSEKELMFNKLADQIILQLKQGAGPMIVNSIREDGVLKTGDAVVIQALATFDATLEEFLNVLSDRMRAKGLYYEERTHRFCLRD